MTKKDKNEEILHSFIDKLYDTFDVKVKTDFGTFKDVYGYKILSKNCLLRTITQAISDDYPIEMFENDEYKVFNKVIFLVISDFNKGKKIDIKRMQNILNSRNIANSLSTNDSLKGDVSNKKAKKQFKKNLKRVNKKEFKIIELKFSKIKIASNNEKSIKLLIKKIGRHIAALAGIKLKKEKIRNTKNKHKI